MKRVLVMALVGQLAATCPAFAADRACDVIQAVLGSWVQKSSANASQIGPLYPKDFRASRGWDLYHGRLEPFIDDFDLTVAERDDLLLRWADYRDGPYTPECAWSGRPMKVMEGDMLMTSTFTQPLFSSDGRIAVLSWGLHSPGRWAHGQTCLVRLGQVGWKAVCRPSWLT